MVSARRVLLILVFAWASLPCFLAPVLAEKVIKPRSLAKGILTSIPAATSEDETFTGPRTIVEIVDGKKELSWDPPPHYTPQSRTLYELSKNVTFRREVWNLEFSFKPLRMIEVDVPQPSGKMQRKRIWYLVYRIDYHGNEFKGKAKLDPDTGNETFPTTIQVERESRRFLPHFVLRSHEKEKEYLDRIIPAAREPILQREFPSSEPGMPALTADQFYNSVEITRVPIPKSEERRQHGVWGFVTWEDIDPRTDYMSIYIKGLTNAFQFLDPDGAFRAGDAPGKGREFRFKTLQLNFWRPGDTQLEHENEIRYGMPVGKTEEEKMRLNAFFGVVDRVDHRWIYR